MHVTTFPNGSHLLQLDCNIENINYYYSITWIFNGGSLPANARLVNNTLDITNPEEFNEGKYECAGKTNAQYAWSKEFVPFYAAYLVTVKGNYNYTKDNGATESSTIQ